MQEFPLSKLKIKIRGVDNPTSVFKKRSYLSLNCIQKSNKSKTPLRIFTSDELPHYMMPIKCHLNKTENNYRSQIRLKVKKPAVKLSILSKNKTDNEMKVIQDNNNKIDNVYDTITVNKNNLNTNFNQDTRLNDCSSSNKDNNENIISELNIINHNNSNNNNGSFDEPSHNSLISDLQKKINEQNILLSTRKKEIENLKNQINKYKNNDIKEDRQEIEKNKNNTEKNEIYKLKEEIKSLKLDLEILDNKYKNELKNKKDIEEKYKFLKNSMTDIKKYENTIIEQKNEIIALNEKLNMFKDKKLIISKESKFQIFSSNKEINDLILSQKQYLDIQLILNVILEIQNIEKNNFSELINNSLENGIAIRNITNEICEKLKIIENDKITIKNYINDFIIKSKNENKALKQELENLFKYKYEDINDEKDFILNSKYKKIIYERCKKYDYKNKHKIPFNYFKHIFNELCHKNKKPFSVIKFFNLLYECKKYNGNKLCSFYDILYDNLKEEENNEIKININYKMKYPDLVKNFLDKIIKEAIEKKKENFGSNKLSRARSFEQDFFDQGILDSESNNNNLDSKG